MKKQKLFLLVSIVSFSISELISSSRRQAVAKAREELQGLYAQRLNRLDKDYRKAFIREAKRITGLNTRKEIDEKMNSASREEVSRDLALIREATDQVQYNLFGDFINNAVNDTTINMQNEQGQTILFKMIKVGDYDLVRNLLDKGSDITLTAALGNTALHQAATVSGTMTQRILEKADTIFTSQQKKNFINRQNKFGNTALILAVEKNNYDTVTELLLADADPNLANNDGFTALHQAILQEKPTDETYAIVAKLLDFKANPDIITTSKLTSKQLNSPLALANKIAYDIEETPEKLRNSDETERLRILYEIIMLMVQKSANPPQPTKTPRKKKKLTFTRQQPQIRLIPSRQQEKREQEAYLMQSLQDLRQALQALEQKLPFKR